MIEPRLKPPPMMRRTDFKFEPLEYGGDNYLRQTYPGGQHDWFVYNRQTWRYDSVNRHVRGIEAAYQRLTENEG